MRRLLCSLLATASLTACAAAPSVTAGPTTPAVVVPTDGYETYVTRHNGFTRIRRGDAQAGDAAILAQFEDSNPASPAGFRSLVDYQNTAVRNRVNTEIIVEQSTTDTINRILRLTTDVEGFTPAQIVAAGGEIVLSGSDYSLVRIGDGAYNAGHQSDSGSLYLALNFDTQSATIHIVNRQLYFHFTGDPGMDLSVVDLVGENLPFNIQTGAFGGDISGEVTQLYVHMGTAIVPVTGTLMANVGGATRDNLVAGGVFEASGSGMVMGRMLDVRVDGLFTASN